MQVAFGTVGGDFDIGHAPQRMGDGGDVFGDHAGVEDEDVVTGQGSHVVLDIMAD